MKVAQRNSTKAETGIAIPGTSGCVVMLLVASLSLPLSAAEPCLLPQQFTLDGPQARQQLLLVWLDGEQTGAELARAEWDSLQSSDPQVVTIEDQVAIAVGDGQATIVATMRDGRQASAVVQVSGSDATRVPSFRNDVESVFARVGCNMGACHGALAGKGGFRLSLRGYDPVADYFSITREALGRRIETADPGQSLLLAKPSGALPHRGGLKLDPDSRDYRILAEWIAAGAPGPADDDARLAQISVVPDAAKLNPGDTSRILVNAHYDDGRVVDVTHWAQFSSTDEAVASVDTLGAVTVRGSGEGAVLVWFGSKIALARLTVPFPHDVSADLFAEAPRRNFIDQRNLEQLETLRLKPSPRCDDATFLRRSTLDTVGRLPTSDERDHFFAQPPELRRDAWIEYLLAHDDFSVYWAYRWSDMLVINGTRIRPAAVKSYYQWVLESVRENKPWDQFVREVITAKGDSGEQGATNFYALNQSPEEMTENACQAFLGLSIGCAKCHNHPLEKWTNDQYYAMANLFARVRAKGWGGDGRNGDGLRSLYVAPEGDLIQPRRRRPQQPAPLDAPPLPIDDPGDRREALADWMTDPANPYFARAITNRVWANFFGRGLVEAVDDLRLSNPASNEPLLNDAAAYLTTARFDLKQLMRAILQSETYQRSSVPLPENIDEQKYLSRYYPRRMMAEVLLDSIDQVLGTTTTFDQIAFPGADKQSTDFYAAGTRAIELYDAAVDSYFLTTFGRNPREITCECERSVEASLVQALHLSNGDTLNAKLSAPNNRIAQLLGEQQLNDGQIIQRLFLDALCRAPTEAELQSLLAVMAEYGSERETAVQDVAWSILTSPEFVFHH